MAKVHFFVFLGTILRYFSSFTLGLYYSQFTLLRASILLYNHAGSLDLSNIWPKIANHRGFSKSWEKLIFFPKKIQLSFSNLNSRSFDQTYSFVNSLCFQSWEGYYYQYDIFWSRQGVSNHFFRGFSLSLFPWERLRMQGSSLRGRIRIALFSGLKRPKRRRQRFPCIMHIRCSFL